MTPAEIEQLIAAEVARVEDPVRRAALRKILVQPSSHERLSQHLDGVFTCWVVARDLVGRYVLVFCIGPFADPWGFLDPASADLGLDSQWFTKLDDAFIAAIWDGPLPPNYEVE